MDNFVLIDGNSIMNRAFYGIMGSKMLTTKDGKYTNAVYGFLAILFKLIEEVKPNYMAVAFDLKAPTARHKMYEGYKANRKGMPEELAEQMPVIKQVLRAMKIDIIEKEGYEADDILGTLSRYGEKQGLEVTILSGDRDTFQLATDNISIRIPHTKAGKTETDIYNRDKIKEVYGLEPKQLIEVKGLQGDTSDNIPGVPGIGEKTALKLIQEYGTIENIYKSLEDGTSNLKGKQKENIENNKDLAELSKTLGTINLEVPIEDTLENFKVEEWDKQEVYKIFKELNFKRYIERFNLEGTEEKQENIEKTYSVKEIINKNEIQKLISDVEKEQKMIFEIFSQPNDSIEKIIKEKITAICIYLDSVKTVYYINLSKENDIQDLKQIFEDNNIGKVGIHLSKTYILLKQENIKLNNLKFDAKIAGYLLNSNNNKLTLENIAEEQLGIDISNYIKKEDESEQITLFEDTKNEENQKEELALRTYILSKLEKHMLEK